MERVNKTELLKNNPCQIASRWDDIVKSLVDEGNDIDEIIDVATKLSEMSVGDRLDWDLKKDHDFVKTSDVVMERPVNFVIVKKSDKMFSVEFDIEYKFGKIYNERIEQEYVGRDDEDKYFESYIDYDIDFSDSKKYVVNENSSIDIPVEDIIKTAFEDFKNV